jgi:hypothetical protein
MMYFHYVEPPGPYHPISALERITPMVLLWDNNTWVRTLAKSGHQHRQKNSWPNTRSFHVSNRRCWPFFIYLLNYHCNLPTFPQLSSWFNLRKIPWIRNATNLLLSPSFFSSSYPWKFNQKSNDTERQFNDRFSRGLYLYNTFVFSSTNSSGLVINLWSKSFTFSTVSSIIR